MTTKAVTALPERYLLILGIAQDAGYPQANCRKDCCRPYWEGKAERKMVSCLGIVDRQSGQLWLIDATPDFKEQLKMLQDQLPASDKLIDGIFLTHAHIGHYTGLMELGREVIGAQETPVYAMLRMREFLTNNGPWSQLVSLQNIELRPLADDQWVMLNDRLRIRPFRVPHRDEYSETVGYHIAGPEKSALFIPDIDKWAKWDRDIRQEVATVDYALLDGTFYRDGELPNRNMADIPHPFIQESMELLAELPAAVRSRVYFIHLNHTNPLLQSDEPARKEVEKRGFLVSEEGMVLGL